MTRIQLLMKHLMRLKIKKKNYFRCSQKTIEMSTYQLRVKYKSLLTQQ